MNNYAIMRFRKLKSVAACRSAIRHINGDLSNAFVNSNSRPNTHANIGERPDNYMKFVRDRLADGQKIRKDNVLALEFILTFSPDAVQPERYQEWAKANFEWLVDEFETSKNVFSFTGHYSESNFHVHAIVAPVHEGKLNCKHFINNKDSLRRLQDRYAEKMSKFGLERGISKEITKRYHKDVRTWQQEQIKLFKEKNIALEQERSSISEQKELLDAVKELMIEDIDFHIAVSAKKGEKLACKSTENNFLNFELGVQNVSR